MIGIGLSLGRSDSTATGYHWRVHEKGASDGGAAAADEDADVVDDVTLAVFFLFVFSDVVVAIADATSLSFSTASCDL